MTVRWNVAAPQSGARQGAVRGLRVATEYLLSEARRIVPIEEGTLERSGVASVDEGDLTGAVSFDGTYAVPQHERLDYRHDAGRSAKYLEKPARERSDEMLRLIAAQVRRALR